MTIRDEDQLMSASEPRLRVAAYVIRPRTRPELLIFEHEDLPEAGVQIPAGGVYCDEGLTQAVLREVAEETGLAGVEIIQTLATEDKPHPTTGQLRRTTYFQLQVPVRTPDAWKHSVTGTGGDGGMVFSCRFHPLPLTDPLADDQDAWLALIDPAFATGQLTAGRNHGLRTRGTAEDSC